MIERNLYSQLVKQFPPPALLDQFPSSCGFAFGFDHEQTVERSQLEAVERWAWSKWIDLKFPLEELRPADIHLSGIAESLFSQFSSFRIFQSGPIWIEFEGRRSGPVRLFVCLGFSGAGVFAGSRVSRPDMFNWDHPATEAWRHMIVARGIQDLSLKSEDIIMDRISYFAENKAHALGQISTGADTPWPIAKIISQWRFIEPMTGGVLIRHLCEDYIGWHIGGRTRFVY